MKSQPILILVCCLLFASCSVSRKQHKALKRAEKAKQEYREEIKKAIALGAVVDTTLNETVYDTVRSEPFHAGGQIDPPTHIDTVRIYEACSELKTRPEEAVRKLQATVCPDIRIYTSYDARFVYNNQVYHFPINVRISNHYGPVTWYVDIPEITIPVIKQIQHLEIKPEIPEFRLKWWQIGLTILGGISLLALGFVLGRILR